MNTFDVILLVVGIACLIVAIVAAGFALERRKARKLASSLLGQACPFCGSPFRQETIRTARLEHGFEDEDLNVVCSNCSRTVTQFEKDRVT